MRAILFEVELIEMRLCNSKMISRAFGQQLIEIQSSRTLQIFGACLGFTYLLSVQFMFRAVFAVLGDNANPMCWPFFSSCWSVRPFSEITCWALLLTLAMSSVLTILFFCIGKSRLGYLALWTAFLTKAFISVQDYSFMGNYHYMPYMMSLVFLLLPKRKLSALQLLLLAFYFAAGTLKLNSEWLEGGAIFNLQPLPWWILKPLLEYVIFLELGLVFLLLIRNSWAFGFALFNLFCFHLFSFWIVGYFYPLVMFALLSIFVLPRALGEPFETFGDYFRLVRLRVSMCEHLPVLFILAVFASVTVYPAFLDGDTAITGEGRILRLNMLDSTNVCQPAIVMKYKNRTEVLPEFESVAPRIRCDVLRYWNIARNLCREKASDIDFQDLDLYLSSRRSTGVIYQRVLSLHDFCKINPEYSMFKNSWILTKEANPKQISNPSALILSHPMPELARSATSEAVSQYRTDNHRSAKSHELIAVRARTFNEVWRQENGNVGIHGASKSSPAVDESGVYVPGDSGWVYKYSREGKLVWSFYSAGVQRGIHSTPTVDKDSVYIGDYRGRLFCLDKMTGRVRWFTWLGGTLGASPAIYKDDLIASIETDAADGFLVRVNRSNGEYVWLTPYAGREGHSSPVIAEADGLVLSGFNNNLMNAYDLQTGELRWSVKTEGAIKSTGLLHPGTRMYYFSNLKGKLYKVDLKNQHVVWEALITSEGFMSSPTYLEKQNILIIGGLDGMIYGIDANSGRIAWSALPPSLKGQDVKVARGEIKSSALGLGVQAVSRGKEVALIGCGARSICMVDSDGTNLREWTLKGRVTGVPVSERGNSIYVSEETPGGLVLLEVN